MKIKQILSTIRNLAYSQGFYGRLLRSLMEIQDNDPERWTEIVDALEGQHFASAVDMVLYFEA